MAHHESLGTDPSYLREVQYKDPANLHARIALHAKHARSAEPWYPWLAARIEWPPHADVLEVGCGSGRLWVSIASLLPPLRLTLTDLSEGMVAAARGAVSSLPGVELVAARSCDAQHLPFDEGAFDVAVANHMLYHVPDPRRAAAELARVLRPTGVLLAATNGSRHLDVVSDLQRQVFGSSPRDFVGRRFGKDNGVDVLGTAFGRVRWHQHESELVCTDPEDVYAFIASTSLAQERPEWLATLRDVIDARFEAEGGALRAATDSGCFVASNPIALGTTREA